MGITIYPRSARIITQQVSPHKNTHISGGTDSFTSTDILEALIKRIRESGGTGLDIGSIADGKFLKRSGTSIIGDDAGGTNVSLLEWTGSANAGTYGGGQSYWPKAMNDEGIFGGGMSGGSPTEPSGSQNLNQIRQYMSHAGTLDKLAVWWDRNTGYASGNVRIWIVKNGSVVSGPHDFASGSSDSTVGSTIITLTSASFAINDYLSIAFGVDTASTAFLNAHYLLSVAYI